MLPIGKQHTVSKVGKSKSLSKSVSKSSQHQYSQIVVLDIQYPDRM